MLSSTFLNEEATAQKAKDALPEAGQLWHTGLISNESLGGEGRMVYMRMLYLGLQSLSSFHPKELYFNKLINLKPKQ